MSSWRNISGPMPFSARHSTQCSGRPHGRPPPRASARKAPNMPAAPPMSRFMPHMPSRGFSAAPPVSKVMPFPTMATPFSPFSPTRAFFAGELPFAPGCVRTSRHGGVAEELFPTAHSRPYPLSRSSSPSISSCVTSGTSRMASRAKSRKDEGLTTLGGRSTKPWAARSASAAPARRRMTSAGGLQPRKLTLHTDACRSFSVFAVYGEMHRATAKPADNASCSPTASNTSWPAILPWSCLAMTSGRLFATQRPAASGSETSVTFRSLSSLSTHGVSAVAPA
mmetsp:Transcript_18037/g.53801  ORF Transcript_18037/g.53801 Transcript_18037/m.53801 type:complete len:281 (-) Transcript_18037:213-1055(-)